MRAIPLTTDQAVVTLLAFSIWEVHKAFRECAPSLSELRSVQHGTDDYYTMRQNLVDAGATVGLIAIGAGVAAAFMTKRPEPLIFVMATLGAVAWYHMSVLDSRPV